MNTSIQNRNSVKGSRQLVDMPCHTITVDRIIQKPQWNWKYIIRNTFRRGDGRWGFVQCPVRYIPAFGVVCVILLYTYDMYNSVRTYC